MIRIVVADQTREIPFTDKKTGKPRVFSVQTAYAFVLDKAGQPLPYPERIDLPLEYDETGHAKPHPPGEYQLHPSAVYVDQRGRLSLAPRLAPVKRPASA